MLEISKSGIEKSCRAGKSDAVVGEPWARPLRKARPGGPGSRPMRSQDCGFGPMRARGGAERGEKVCGGSER